MHHTFYGSQCNRVYVCNSEKRMQEAELRRKQDEEAKRQQQLQAVTHIVSLFPLCISNLYCTLPHCNVKVTI